MQFFTPFPSSIKEIKTIHFLSVAFCSRAWNKMVRHFDPQNALENKLRTWPDKSQALGCFTLCSHNFGQKGLLRHNQWIIQKEKKQDENALDSRHSYTNFQSLCASHPSLGPREYLAKWIRWLELMIDHCRMVAKGWAKIEKTDDHCGEEFYNFQVCNSRCICWYGSLGEWQPYF